jgi:hypothetical protein
MGSVAKSSMRKGFLIQYMRKSGQILSRNNSKMVLNIVLLVTEYINCLQRLVAAQWLQVSDLWQRLRGRRLKEGAPYS